MLIQVLTDDKDVGLRKLNGTFQCSDKLYPDTSVIGRENVRQQVLTAKSSWNSLVSDLAEVQRRHDASATMLQVFQQQCQAVEDWMRVTELKDGRDLEPKNTLQEKHKQLHTQRVGRLSCTLEENIRKISLSSKNCK